MFLGYTIGIFFTNTICKGNRKIADYPPDLLNYVNRNVKVVNKC